MTYDSWLKETIKRFLDHKNLSARLDAFLILESVTKKDRPFLLAHLDDNMSLRLENRANLARQKRLSGQPIAYILNKKEFYGREFMVSKDVLIPRPDSEMIIELLKKHISSQNNSSLLDVGTGSGCLAITAKLEFPQMIVSSCDISKKALRVAKKNSLKLGASVNFFESNLLENAREIYNYMLVNLPYVPSGLEVSSDVKAEPRLAVFSGADGLDLTRKFFDQVNDKLAGGGLVIMESLQIQHKKINQLAQEAGLNLVESKDLVQVFKKSS